MRFYTFPTISPWFLANFDHFDQLGKILSQKHERWHPHIILGTSKSVLGTKGLQKTCSNQKRASEVRDAMVFWVSKKRLAWDPVRLKKKIVKKKVFKALGPLIMLWKCVLGLGKLKLPPEKSSRLRFYAFPNVLVFWVSKKRLVWDSVRPNFF